MAIGKTNSTSRQLSNTQITYQLAHDPIGKLLMRYAIPAIVGTMVMSLYNIVDRIYIGQGVGPDAISGLAITFPVMTLSMACGVLIGAGGGARISIALGKGDHENARKILGNAFILVLIIATLFSSISYTWMKPILYAFGATEATFPYAQDYLKIIIPFTILNNLSFGFNNMMRASGYPKKAMYTMLISAIANVILDPIFIFVFKMGIEGAAIATVISMTITLVWVMGHFINSKHTVSFCKGCFKLKKRFVLSIISIGFSPFLINLTASIVNVFFNRTLLIHGGHLAIGAFGIITSFTMIIVMMIMGLCQGMQPIVGYNYGAQQYKRVEDVFKKTVLVATCFSSIGFFSSIFTPKVIVNAFTTDLELSTVAQKGLKMMLLGFPIVGFQIVTTTLFQSLGMAWKAVFLSLSRQIIFLIPLISFLPSLWGLNGVWITQPIADICAGILAAIFLIYQWNRFKIQMNKQPKIQKVS